MERIFKLITDLYIFASVIHKIILHSLIFLLPKRLTQKHTFLIILLLSNHSPPDFSQSLPLTPDKAFYTYQFVFYEHQF
jgi:hypothetical protein